MPDPAALDFFQQCAEWFYLNGSGILGIAFVLFVLAILIIIVGGRSRTEDSRPNDLNDGPRSPHDDNLSGDL